MDLPSMETMMLDPASGLTAGTADDVRIATIVDGRGRAGKTTVANVATRLSGSWPVRRNWSPLWSSIGSDSCSGRYSAPMSRISII